MPDSMTQILSSGPPGMKINIAVLGDGFAAADQTAYNNKVQDLLLDGVFGHDYFYEDKSGVQHLPRQPDLGAVRGQPAGLQRKRNADRRHRRHDRLDDDQNTALGYIYKRLVGALLARERCQHRRRRSRTPSTRGCRTTTSSWSSSTSRASAAAEAAASRSSRWVELGGDGARVRPRHRRACRRVLRSAGYYAGGEPGAST